MIQEIEFVNRTDKYVTVEEEGRTLLVLPPGGKQIAEIYDWKTSYSRWKRVIFLENGRMNFDENPAWDWGKIHPEKLMLEALNRDGTATQSFAVAGEYYHCYQGIPRYIPVDSHNTAWAFVEKIQLVWVETKRLDGDYLIPHRNLQWIKTMRSAKARHRIENKLEEEAVSKARQEMKRQFIKPQEAEILQEDENGKDTSATV